MKNETRLDRSLNARMSYLFAALTLMASATLAHGQTMTEQAKLSGSDTQQFDQFGSAAAISGNTAVVGAWNVGWVEQFDDDGTGALYVLVRQDNGTPDDLSDDTWTEQAKLLDSDSDNFGEFGNRAVAIDGDTIVAGRKGAPGSSSSIISGAAYVFVRSGDSWYQQQKLLPDVETHGDGFGFSVAIDGDTIVVGAVRNDSAGSNAGAAYIFVRSGSTWTQQQVLTASDPQDNGFFGVSVGISSNTVAVGTTGSISSAAYVFVRSGEVWSEQQKLTADDAAGGDLFAANLAIDGDTVIISAHRDDDRGVVSGSAYVFFRNGDTWSQQQKLLANDTTELDRFGFSVSLDGETALIGTQFKKSAYIFRRTGANWSQEYKLLPSDAPVSGFGLVVSISGNTALVGAEFDNGLTGAAYVFDITPAPLIQNELAKILPTGTASNGFFGEGAAMNADGTVVLVGASLDDEMGISGAGSAYIFRFDGTTWVQEARLTASDAADGDGFGFALDLSADGNTALISSEASDDFGINSGSAYVFRFDGMNWTQESDKLTASDAAAHDIFGESVTLSDDGTVAVVGAPGNDSGSGSAYIFRFDGTSWVEEQILLASDGVSGDGFGDARGVAIAGNTAAIGAHLADMGGLINTGAVYLYEFDGSSWIEQPRLLPSETQRNRFFGDTVSFSADGTVLLVGASGDDGTAIDSGAAYVFTFDGTSWNQQAKLVASDARTSDTFGFLAALSGAGNIAIIGTFDNSAYVFRFDGTNWVQEAKYLASDGGNDDFSFSTAISNDGELALFGAGGNDEAGTNVGAAYIFEILDFMVETPTGSNVVVEPADSSTADVITTITFDQVTSDGVTTMSSSDGGPALPAGFQLGDPGTYYDISTTANFTGSVEICIDYSDVTFSDEATLELLHFENDAWVNIRTSIDTTNKIICGTTTSFSPFAIVDSQNAVDPIELLITLIDDVADLNIQHGIQNSLDAKLDAAFDAFLDVAINNNGAGINVLDAFINAVQAQSGNQIPASDANALITDAEAIIALLEVQM